MIWLGYSEGADSSDNLDFVQLSPGQEFTVQSDRPGRWDYRFQLPPDHHWQLQVQENGVDLVVTVMSEQAKYHAINETKYLWDVHQVSADSGPGGVHRVKVERPPALTTAGKFQISLQVLADKSEEFEWNRQESLLISAYEQADATSREQALQRLAAFVDSALKDGPPARRWSLLLALASRYNASGKPSQAVASMRRAMAADIPLPQPDPSAMILEKMAWPNRTLAQRDVAINLLQQAEVLSLELGDNLTRARAHNGRCMLAMNEGLHLAESCFRAALEFAKQAGDLDLQVKIDNNLGGVSSDLGEPMVAAEHFRRAIVAWAELGDHGNEAVVQTNLANELRRIGRIDEALRQYYQALVIARDQNDASKMGYVLNQLGFTYLELGHVERAKIYLQRSLQRREQAGDVNGKAVTLNNLARTMAVLGHLDQALALQREVVAIRRQAGDPRRLGISLMRLAESQILAEDWPATARSLNEARRLAVQVKDRGTMAKIDFLESKVALVHGRLMVAAQRAASALSTYGQIQNRAGVLETELQLARVELAEGAFERVTQRLQEVLSEAEKTRRRLVNPQLRASFLTTVRQAYELQIAVLWRRYQRSGDSQLIRRAFDFSEMARSRTLVDVMAQRRSGEEDERLQRRRALVERLNAKSDRLVRILSRGGDTAEIARLRLELRHIEIDLDALDANAEAQAGQGPRMAQLAQIQQSLADNTALAQYFVGDEYAWVWHVANDQIAMAEIPNRERLSDSVKQLLVLASDPNSDRQKIYSLGKSLGRQLLVAKPAERLLLAADGPLHQLPFALLVAPDAETWLVENTTLLSVPSFSALSIRNRQPRVETPKLLAIADPVYEGTDRRLVNGASGPPPPLFTADDLALLRSSGGQGLTRLRASQVEVEVLKNIGGLTLEVLSGFDASTARLVGRNLLDYSVLHFATHGVVSPDDPSATGVVLSLFDSSGRPQVGLMNTDLVRQLELAADLVVLSGCETAVGQRISGEGMFGLARAFYEAGAQSVIASLWQVSDRATAELISEFYHRHLGSGLSAPRALAGAARAMMKQPRFRHPFYWAAFTYNGASFVQ